MFAEVCGTVRVCVCVCARVRAESNIVVVTCTECRMCLTSGTARKRVFNHGHHQMHSAPCAFFVCAVEYGWKRRARPVPIARSTQPTGRVWCDCYCELR